MPRNFLVLGVGSGKVEALDPTNPGNILRYRQNFHEILAISYSDLPQPSPPGVRVLESVADLGEAFLNLGGIHTERVIGELLPLRDQRIDVLIAHSWGAAAVMEALYRGFIRRPPARLVIVGPPNLTPAGGDRWRRLAESYPAMSIDVYVSRRDVLQVVRETIQRLGAAVSEPAISSLPPSEEEIASGVLAYFTARRVRVHTYPAPFGLLEAHALRHFLDFAAGRGLYDLRRGGTVAPPAPVQDNSADDAFVVEVRHATARVAAVEDLARRQAMSLRDVLSLDEADGRENGRLMWRYFVSIVESACAGASQPRLSPHGVVFAYAVLRQWGRASSEELSDCGRALLDRVLEADRPVTFGWVRTEARRYRAGLIEEAREREKSARRAARREAQRRRTAEARERVAGAISTSGCTPFQGGPERERSIRLPDIEKTGAIRDLRGVLGDSGWWDGG